MTKILDGINNPGDLKRLTLPELEQLASEIRQELVSVVSANGGHLASNLGVVELTIALHRFFDAPRDKIVWDVGHQTYAHKLITGRRKEFASLRQYGGLSGFTSREESGYDTFGAGHSSTSISAALGMAVARDFTGEKYNVVAVIGDGGVTGGMALEGLNQVGHTGTRLIVVLNDNGMSISPTVGAIARLLDKIRFDNRYRIGKARSQRLLNVLPFGKKVWRIGLQIESWLKDMTRPTRFFESFGFNYIGPVDGHDFNKLEIALNRARNYTTGPILVHVVTTKGSGYLPAEGNAVYFHGISGTNGTSKKKTAPTYSDVFAQVMLKIARENSKLVVITPAMPEGNSLNIVQEEFPNRVFDVGICEQHAVTFAAGLATQGYLPVLAIYSTFLQRSFDQIIHDVCLQELPVVFAIDRGGIVGEDGKTHQGIFDLSYLSLIPNIIVSSPKDENELQHLLYTAVKSGKIMAVRYPRSAGLGVKMDTSFRELPIGKGEILRQGSDVAILAIGSMVAPALEAAQELAQQGIEATVVNARFVKPIDTELIIDLATRIRRIVTVEENTLSGGFGSYVADTIKHADVSDVKMRSIGIPDVFVEHGGQSFLRSKYGMDAKGIVKQTLAIVPAGSTVKTAR
ncbi:MAG: 1-deoxy-D-xylulose-5-phosphate synthase [Dehalococcoidales bacterium]|nr:1-deoxy-D-xylulose-5-phosphate synthase [Dehalococcoidales bacterium]